METLCENSAGKKTLIVQLIINDIWELHDISERIKTGIGFT